MSALVGSGSKTLYLLNASTLDSAIKSDRQTESAVELTTVSASVSNNTEIKNIQIKNNVSCALGDLHPVVFPNPSSHRFSTVHSFIALCTSMDEGDLCSSKAEKGPHPLMILSGQHEYIFSLLLQ